MKTEKGLAAIYEHSQEVVEAMPIANTKKKAIRNARKCADGSLGAMEFASDRETIFIKYTCKSPACAECGAKRAIAWIRNQLCSLPDIPWQGITLTMPSQLWPVFRDNQELLRHLPDFGAHAIDEWARSRARAIPFVLVVMQTANGELIFKPHLHIICSKGGVDTGKSKWIADMELKDALNEIMEIWKAKVTNYLAEAYADGQATRSVPKQFKRHLDWQRTRKWHVWIDEQTTYELVNYDGRYVARPPITDQCIKEVSKDGVLFIAKVYPNDDDDEVPAAKNGKSKIDRPVFLSLEDFMVRISNHLPAHYQHSVRYFGLFSPRLRRLALSIIEAEIPQVLKRIGAHPVTKEPWAPRDSQGKETKKIRSISPLEIQLREKPPTGA